MLWKHFWKIRDVRLECYKFIEVRCDTYSIQNTEWADLIKIVKSRWRMILTMKTLHLIESFLAFWKAGTPKASVFSHKSKLYIRGRKLFVLVIRKYNIWNMIYIWYLNISCYLSMIVKLLSHQIWTFKLNKIYGLNLTCT